VEVVEARKWSPPLLSRSTVQATAYSRMLSPHCRCVVAPRNVEEHHFVCLEVAGALTTIPTCHGRQVAILRLCCTLVATPIQYEEGRWPSSQPDMETAHPRSQRTQEASGKTSTVHPSATRPRQSFPGSLGPYPVHPSLRSHAISPHRTWLLATPFNHPHTHPLFTPSGPHKAQFLYSLSLMLHFLTSLL
jgi:hypothetical protein